MQKVLTILLIIVAIALYVCATKDNTQQISGVKAVYLVATSGVEISKQDLEAHSQILVVHTAKGFKKAAKNNVALWIDKYSLDVVEQEWFKKTNPANRLF